MLRSGCKANAKKRPGVVMWSLIVKSGETKQVTNGSGLKTTGSKNSRAKKNNSLSVVDPSLPIDRVV